VKLSSICSDWVPAGVGVRERQGSSLGSGGPSSSSTIELLGRSDVLKGLAIHPNGRWLATLGDFQKVGLWPLHRRYSRVLFRGTSRWSHQAGGRFCTGR